MMVFVIAIITIFIILLIHLWKEILLHALHVIIPAIPVMVPGNMTVYLVIQMIKELFKTMAHVLAIPISMKW